MSFQGLYDPTGYVSGDWLTYPLPTGETDQYAARYQPGQYWEFDRAGTIDGDPVAAGDRWYVSGRARRFGDLTFGRGDHGDPAGHTWLIELTEWTIWYPADDPWLEDPTPDDGCELQDGWGIVVDYLERDPLDPDVWAWHDLTPDVVDAQVVRGDWSGGQVQPVDVIRFGYRDDGYTISLDPAGGDRFGLDSMVRVGLRSPAGEYTALAAAKIVSVSDSHGYPPAGRIVTVEAAGTISDTVVTMVGWDEPAEPVVPRIERIMAALDWAWAPNDYPATPHWDLLATEQLENTEQEARRVLDWTAASGGWTMDTTRRGQIRFRDWPLDAGGAPLFAAYDCPPDVPAAGDVTARQFTLTADLGELLNRVILSNTRTAPRPDVIDERDDDSIAAWGARDRGHNLPFLELSTGDAARLLEFATRILGRYANVVQRPSLVQGDSAQEPGWLEVFAALDTGARCQVVRTDPAMTATAVITGYTVTFTANPGRVSADIYTSGLPVGA